MLENLITPFNILNFILAILILIVGSYKTYFYGRYYLQYFIGTVQEIRAKKPLINFL